MSSAANEVPHLRERITTLGNMVEGLKAQLEQKNHEERRLQSEVNRLELSNKEESLTVQRLSMQNEQLWYKLQSLQRRPSPTHSQNGTFSFHSISFFFVFYLYFGFVCRVVSVVVL